MNNPKLVNDDLLTILLEAVEVTKDDAHNQSIGSTLAGDMLTVSNLRDLVVLLQG